MELNTLVFPAPFPSYTHETMNSGAFIDKLEDLAAFKKLNWDWIVKAKMLYVPKFKIYKKKEEGPRKAKKRGMIYSSMNY